MPIGVIVDTHDRLTTIEAELKLFDRRGVEAILHVGDFVAPYAVRSLIKYEMMN